MQINKNNLFKLVKDLFPLHRSLITDENEKSLKYISKNLKIKFNKIKFKCGSKVYDWIIPYKWILNNAYIKNIKGKKIIDVKRNNLHVLQYSHSIKGWMSKKDLLKKIFTDNSKHAIPYVASYYRKRWGFCVSKNQLRNFKGSKFYVNIDSQFKKEHLNISEILIRGKSKKEIFFSTYICHPSMANDNISSVAVQAFLIKYIKENFKKTKYSYRFVFLPETIGSISYISKRIKTLKKNVIFGFTLSCLGDDKNYSIINSPNKNFLSDYALEASLINHKKVKKYSFLDRGSDERQYCSPRVNLPITGFAKSKYHTFKEYHTSLDNLSFISSKGLFDSFNTLKRIVDACENSDIFPISNFICEPNLGKRSLISTISKKNDGKNKTLKNFIAYCDGNRSIFEISIILKKNLEEISKLCQKLFLKKIIQYKKKY
tara:strand:- start:6509 stop:7798 length:1290 start_codon:yes stop_codon:yes gene_type:complete